jgi:hypothetical protein
MSLLRRKSCVKTNLSADGLERITACDMNMLPTRFRRFINHLYHVRYHKYYFVTLGLRIVKFHKRLCFRLYVCLVRPSYTLNLI